MRPAGRQGPKSVRGSLTGARQKAAAGTLRREWIGLQFLHGGPGGSAPSRRTGKDCLGLFQPDISIRAHDSRTSGGDEVRLWAECGCVFGQVRVLRLMDLPDVDRVLSLRIQFQQYSTCIGEIHRQVDGSRRPYFVSACKTWAVESLFSTWQAC